MSIKRGIEVLRSHQFNLATLKRRPSPERQINCSTLNGGVTGTKDRDVSLWTNHRVMEWLRMIDLSEYAANLRGSGVHGALIVSDLFPYQKSPNFNIGVAFSKRDMYAWKSMEYKGIFAVNFQVVYSSIMVLQQHNACLHIKYMHSFLNLKPHAFLSYSEKKLILMTV